MKKQIRLMTIIPFLMAFTLEASVIHFDTLRFSVNNNLPAQIVQPHPGDHENVGTPWEQWIKFNDSRLGMGGISMPELAVPFTQIGMPLTGTLDPHDKVLSSGYAKNPQGHDYFQCTVLDTVSKQVKRFIVFKHPAIPKGLLMIGHTLYSSTAVFFQGKTNDEYFIPLWQTFINSVTLDPPGTASSPQPAVQTPPPAIQALPPATQPPKPPSAPSPKPGVKKAKPI